MKMRPSLKKLTASTVIVVLVIGLGVYFESPLLVQRRSLTLPDTTVVDKKPSGTYRPGRAIATAKEVRDYAASIGASHPDELTAHLALESGWFSSPLAQTRNNIGGVGGPGRYKRYADWRECVDEVVRMQRKAGLDAGDSYYAWLNGSGYHQSNNAAYNRLLMSMVAETRRRVERDTINNREKQQNAKDTAI